MGIRSGRKATRNSAPFQLEMLEQRRMLSAQASVMVTSQDDLSVSALFESWDATHTIVTDVTVNGDLRTIRTNLGPPQHSLSIDISISVVNVATSTPEMNAIVSTSQGQLTIGSDLRSARLKTSAPLIDTVTNDPVAESTDVTFFASGPLITTVTNSHTSSPGRIEAEQIVDQARPTCVATGMVFTSGTPAFPINAKQNQIPTGSNLLANLFRLQDTTVTVALSSLASASQILGTQTPILA